MFLQFWLLQRISYYFQVGFFFFFLVKLLLFLFLSVVFKLSKSRVGPFSWSVSFLKCSIHFINKYGWSIIMTIILYEDTGSLFKYVNGTTIVNLDMKRTYRVRSFQHSFCVFTHNHPQRLGNARISTVTRADSGLTSCYQHSGLHLMMMMMMMETTKIVLIASSNYPVFSAISNTFILLMWGVIIWIIFYVEDDSSK